MEKRSVANCYSLSPCLPISVPSWSAETPERLAPLRCSDIGFIVKHLPSAVDPETALQGKRMLQPREGGRTKSRNLAQADDEASAYANKNTSELEK